MKKIIKLLLVSVLLIAVLVGCSAKTPQTEGNTTENNVTENNKTDSNVAEKRTLVVGASVTPHAEILQVAKEILAEKGIELKIVEFTDYVQPNLNVDNGELDANYFQHKPYLDQFNKDHGTDLVSVAAIHYEPFGIYPGKIDKIEDLPEGAVISVPNDGTNEARALFLLEDLGLITLKEGTDFTATILDIAENPKKLDIKELEAAQLTLSRQDVDMAVINGNYAIQDGLNASTDALATEDKDSEAAQTYANILCVKKGNENDPAILELIEALKSDKVKTFMEEKYKGAVVPIF
ncbi:MAG: metal ABC transporter substrate-binding protein [Clostridiaceae bacterium]|nr:metal ABC transporter substrate-binding protein [Clostridiaceae bacterium]